MNSREFNQRLHELIKKQREQWIFFGDGHFVNDTLSITDIELLIGKLELYPVTQLGLANVNLSDELAIPLIHALAENNRIELLYLPFNHLSDLTANAIADMLMQNTSIKELILFANEMTNDGVNAIANALIANNTLLKLELFNNLHFKKVIKTFIDSVQLNHEIEMLTLFPDYYRPAELDILNGLLAHNQAQHRAGHQAIKSNLSSHKHELARLSMMAPINRFSRESLDASTSESTSEPPHKSQHQPH